MGRPHTSLHFCHLDFMKISALVASLAFAPVLLSAQTTLSTPGSGSVVTPFGRPDTQTYGQTFRTPAVDTKLDNFAFWIASEAAFEMKAHLFAWDGQKATGSALFISDLLFAPVGELTKTTVQIGGVNLLAGNAYVFFLSTSGLRGSSRGGMECAIECSDAYTDGAFVFQNNGDDTSKWTNEEWRNFNGDDLRFEANFSAVDQNVVPEPSTYQLMASGLLGLGAVARRRRQT